MEGRVSVEGKKYRAFTSSKLLTRADGSLCDVAIVYICGTPDYQWADPLTLDGEDRAAYLSLLSTRYHYERKGTYLDLCEYARCLQAIADGSADKYPHCEHRERAAALRSTLAPVMNWGE